MPPEPCQEDLPGSQNGELVSDMSDEKSVGSASTSSDRYKSVQDKAAEILSKTKLRYTYDTFPSEFVDDNFSIPRPLSAAVLAEFDRQKKDAAQFRRKKPVLTSKNTRNGLRRSSSNGEAEKPPSPEVATFTVFFMAFTAVVGKELMGMSYDSENGEGRAILSTNDTDQPKNRFRDSLNASEIEEAKATGRAQLGLAFEMLTMMKKRALKADPEAYQSLIDACGRVGDTKRASDLLARMQQDGIVTDGTVYACLVAAFSADTAWRNGEKDEDLPGMFTYCIIFPFLVRKILTTRKPLLL